MDLPFPLPETKVVICNNCGADVIVNASYPITAVEQCANCGLYGETPHTWNTWKNNS